MSNLANSEIQLFGKTTKVNSSGFFSAPNGETFKAFEIRSKFKGRRRTMSEVLEMVADLFQQGKTGSEIALIVDRDSDTIGKYKKIILAFDRIDQNAIMQTRTDAGEFRSERMQQFVSRYHQVAKWQDRLMSKDKASKKTIKAKASALNRICKALKMSPMALLQLGLTGDEQLTAIDDLMRIVNKEHVTSESSFYQCRMALRNWVSFNGIHIPKPCQYSYIHGEVVSTHGEAAHVRMSKEELARANAILENPKSKLPYPERRTDTEIFFKFGVETCSRQTAILTAKIEGGWNSVEQMFKTIERKLYHVGKHRMEKRIFCPELVRLINAKQQAGEPCLIGKPNEYVKYETMEKESSDDVKQNKRQTEALKELNANLRAVYEQTGGNATDKYFTEKPSHTLRHVGAQYWLRKSDFDFGFVAKLGGWTTVSELEKSYGGMPREIYEKKYDQYIKNDL